MKLTLSTFRRSIRADFLIQKQLGKRQLDRKVRSNCLYDIQLIWSILISIYSIGRSINSNGSYHFDRIRYWSEKITIELIISISWKHQLRQTWNQETYGLINQSRMSKTVITVFPSQWFLLFLCVAFLSSYFLTIFHKSNPTYVSMFSNGWIH